MKAIDPERVWTGVGVFTIAVLAFVLGGSYRSTAQEPMVGNDTVHRVETGLRALTTEGCHRREGIWTGEVTSNQRVMVPFFLFKENQYVLVIAADDARSAESTLNIEMLDLVGIPVACHTGSGEGRIAIAARPTFTGTCYLSLTLPKGSRPLNVAVGCAYR